MLKELKAILSMKKNPEGLLKFPLQKFEHSPSSILEHSPYHRLNHSHPPSAESVPPSVPPFSLISDSEEADREADLYKEISTVRSTGTSRDVHAVEDYEAYCGDADDDDDDDDGMGYACTGTGTEYAAFTNTSSTDNHPGFCASSRHCRQQADASLESFEDEFAGELTFHNCDMDEPDVVCDIGEPDVVEFTGEIAPRSDACRIIRPTPGHRNFVFNPSDCEDADGRESEDEGVSSLDSIRFGLPMGFAGAVRSRRQQNQCLEETFEEDVLLFCASLRSIFRC